MADEGAVPVVGEVLADRDLLHGALGGVEDADENSVNCANGPYLTTLSQIKLRDLFSVVNEMFDKGAYDSYLFK